MFYISLPYFYENFKFNQFFKRYINEDKNFKDSRLITKFNIEYAYGAFPWNFWNGNINNHYGKIVLSPDMNELFSNSIIPIRLDFSNINLIETDYYDTQGNAILKASSNSNTTYEISNPNLIPYISNIVLNNKYIISNNAELIHLFTEDIISTFQQQSCIDFINIGYYLNYDLSKIDKTKLEISIGHCQHCPPDKILSCANIEQTNIYNYSSESCYIKCCNEYKPINYYQEILPYYQQGIKHFKIITNSLDLNNFNINIIKSFIKPEYQGECIDEYYRATSK